MGRAFIAISTGQNIANVAPLAELVNDNDEVFWIDTLDAQNKAWTTPAQRVLAGQSKCRQRRIAVPSNEAHDLVTALRSTLPSSGDLVVIANGGTKLQSLALAEALNTRRHAIAYSLHSPCAYEWMPDGIGGPMQMHSYQRHRLGLRDVLALRDMDMQVNADGDICGKQIWPASAPQPDHAEDSYGVDDAVTFAIHDHSQFRATNRPRLSIEDLPTYNEMKSRKPGGERRFRLVVASGNQTNADKLAESHVAGIFGSARKLIAWTSSEPAPRQESQPALGPRFERAVEQRLLAWTQRRPELAAVLQSVWANVVVVAQSAPQRATLEVDLLLVLKNGMLLGVECKSHKAESKDLDARLLNLQASGSLLARMAICSPLFTAANDKPWFSVHHELRQRVLKDGRFAHVPFTLLDQADSYQYATDNEDNEPAHWQCSSFEAALDSFLAAYQRPATSPSSS